MSIGRLQNIRRAAILCLGAIMLPFSVAFAASYDKGRNNLRLADILQLQI